MKRNLVLPCMLASCSIYAGSMGPVATAETRYFASAEGGYTWSQMQGSSFNFSGLGVIGSSRNEEGGTARVALGVMHPIMNNLVSLSAELGWGYYGRSKFSPTFLASDPTTPLTTSLLRNAFSASTALNGFDVLAGVSYHVYPNMDLFFKAGALIENARTTVNANLAPLETPTVVGVKLNSTQALPEIRLGGSYCIWNDLSLFAAWTHAFGDSSRTRAQFNDFDDDAANLSAFVNLRNPTLDVATIGLQYNFS